MQTQTHRHRTRHTTSQVWSPSLTDVRVGCRNPEGAVRLHSHPPCVQGWHEGRWRLKSPFLQYPQRLACVFPKPVSGLGPDSTVWHGVGSCLAGSPTWPSPWIPWGLPGVHEPLLSCLPRLGHEWKGELVLRRPELPASAPPYLRSGQCHRDQLPGRSIGEGLRQWSRAWSSPGPTPPLSTTQG